MPVILDDHRPLTRFELIRDVANKDGGAHDVAQIEGLDELEGDLRLTTSAQPQHPHDV